MKAYLRIHENDNTAVALKDLPAGTAVSFSDLSLTITENIPQGHKFALRDLAEGERVIKYGAPIGYTTAGVKKGAWLHTHNVRTGLSGTPSYHYEPVNAFVPTLPPAFFRGYRRKDGRVGIRNELWILPTVGCVNDIARRLEKAGETLLSDTVDAVHAFTHPYGCSQLGTDQENFLRIYADLVHHPNAGGVLVLGLGCENSNIGVLKEVIGETDPARVKFLNCQEVDDEIKAGTGLLQALARTMSGDLREEIPASELVIGMKCGGSDGLSGITANPCIGAFSDLLIGMGGTTVLTEVPEMFGAETTLMNRAENEEIYRETVKLIEDFKAYFVSHGQPVYENPSPGNKAGGITTLEDKSLGCTQKSGSAPVKAVLSYGARVEKKGLQLLSAPGNDLVASTALAAAGCQMVLFSTGRGTPFASCVPTVKIFTNTPLALKKPGWMDFNAGLIADGEKTTAELAGDLLTLVLEIASGKKVRSEADNYHDIAVFKTGVTL